MSAGTFVIEESLKLLGAHSLVAAADNETMTSAMHRLNGMIQRWESEGIKTGATWLEASGDELNEPMDATNAIIDNLALELSPGFKDSVPERLTINAGLGKGIVESLYQSITINPKVASAHLLRGQGNKSGYSNDVFFGPDRTVND